MGTQISGERLRSMKVCEVKGTNQGLVTTYKTLTSQYIHLYIIYLRNKETQHTLRVIVSIQYDASF